MITNVICLDYQTVNNIIDEVGKYNFLSLLEKRDYIVTTDKETKKMLKKLIANNGYKEKLLSNTGIKY